LGSKEDVEECTRYIQKYDHWFKILIKWDTVEIKDEQ
jgi:hypothetical protein